MDRWTAMEQAGVTLIAVALWMWLPAVAVGWVGIYLFATGVLNQASQVSGEVGGDED